MYTNFNINNKIIDYVNSAEEEISYDFDRINKICENNQLKILKAYISNRVCESDFQESTGYGYTDIGRDKIEKIFSEIFGTEDAIVRQQIVSGTHAISATICGLTRPGDNILSITGKPYDTIQATFKYLNEYNISFDYADISDFENKINDNTKLILIQRSRGYSDRNAYSIDEIRKLIERVKKINSNLIVMVDNCYGELVDILEPTNIGADVTVGSLIKNLGGSLAKTGAYIVGNKNLIEKISYRITAPGIGKEVGNNFNENRSVLQGLYNAPQVVSNSLKISKLFIHVFSKLGYETVPKDSDLQNDIVTAIKFNNAELLKKFCEVIQKTSPVDSHVKPVETDMPGYDSKVIMACGSFISGASIELSCDGPMIEPYFGYLQGGISYFQGKLALMKVIQELELLK